MQNDMECQKSVDVFKEFGNFYVKLLHSITTDLWITVWKNKKFSLTK